MPIVALGMSILTVDLGKTSIYQRKIREHLENNGITDTIDFSFL